MANSTPQPASTAVLPPTDAAEHLPHLGVQYAVISAHTAPGRDWVAVVNLSPLYGVPKYPPEYWRIYRLRGRGHETIELFAGTFYRARIEGLHFGMYVDVEGEINYFQKKAFERELGSRFRDDAKTIGFTCNGD